MTHAGDRETVSVVITCFNQARYIAEAIESVLAQTYSAFEVIIIDDGSVDQTSDVVSHYPSVRYIRQDNQGVVRARNRGIRESSGRYFALLDGDDRLLTTALETQVEYFKKYPDCAFVAGRANFLRDDGRPLDWTIAPVAGDDYYLALLQDNFIVMPAMVLHRRALFEKIAPDGFSAAANHSSDYELYLRTARQARIHCHNEAVAEYRVHHSNTSSNAPLMLRGTMRVYRLQWQYVKGRREYEQAYRRGSSKWKERYGGEVVAAIRLQLQRGGWQAQKQVFSGLSTLLVYSPGVFRRVVWQKLKNTFTA